MNRITKDIFDRITLNASLQRLDVVELEERLEFSPLLAEGGLPEMDSSTQCCLCKIPDGDLDLPDIVISDPGTDGMGSTGPTGGLRR